MNPVEQLHEDWEWSLSLHVAGQVHQSKIDALNAKAREFAHMVIGNCPISREQSVALTHIETAFMYAAASIARMKEQV